MRTLTSILVFVLLPVFLKGQEAFFIRNFDVDVVVNENASLDVTEKITVEFTRQRHGIFRKIPYRYRLQSLPDTEETAEMPWVSRGYRYTKLKNIKVRKFKYEVRTDGDYKTIKIGSQNRYVQGEQVYQISYTIVGAINFFKDFSELYLNITGNAWPVEIQNASFAIHLPKSLADKDEWFVATGIAGSTDNVTDTRWVDDRTLKGELKQPLQPYEGITIGVRMPPGFLSKPDLMWMGKGWLLVPLLVFFIMYLVWRKWGKDLPVTVTTQFYPPEGISPSVAGYVIDGRLDKRDLTALIPYWGGKGFLRVEEIQKKKLLGLLNDTEYKFIKRKDLPADAKIFEKTMFNGLFYDGDEVLLSDLKNSFYTTMNASKRDLESEIKTQEYYVKYTRVFATLLPIAGLILTVLSIINLLSNYPTDVLLWSSMIASSLIVVIFGALMEKKTAKGTALYQDLLGFREFIKSVEKDRLREFLKQDENYFDKVLPFAIVFDVADTWKDKLKGLDIPPPEWYSGYYAGSNFNTMMFMSSLNRGLNSMSQSFYSTPASSGSSGGSFSGGGSSGGGFGGGGGGSW